MQLSSGKQIRLISRNNSYSFKPKLDYLKEKSNIITRLVSCLQVPLCVRFKHEEIRRVSHRWKSKETHSTAVSSVESEGSLLKKAFNR